MGNTDPTTFQRPFDHYAFNTLAAMGAIEAFHAGNKKIYITEETARLIAGSSPFTALSNHGWKFIMITESITLISPA